MQRLSAIALSAGLMTLTLAGCQTQYQTQSRNVPDVRAVIPAPAPRPVVRAGDDARVAARKGFNWGRQNEVRLVQARRNYQCVSDWLETGAESASCR